MESKREDATREVDYTPLEKDDTDSTFRRIVRRSGPTAGPQLFRPVLICLSGIQRGQRKALTTASLTIGRSHVCDWQIDDASASRRHLIIRYLNYNNPQEMPRCTAEDLKSRNGTQVNGVDIEGEAPLNERDRILVGSTVIGLFVRDEAELSHDEAMYFSATSDVLTGLDNRRQLREHLKHQLARARRQNHQIAFLLLDLDHFKSVNDRYGHDVGDEALCHVASLLKKSCRESDLVARWGGEEFALCLPDTTPDHALALAERIRQSIEMSPLYINGHVVQMTACLGGTCYRPGDDSDTLFQRADQMLYRAKNAGRNRVEFTAEAVKR